MGNDARGKVERKKMKEEWNKRWTDLEKKMEQGVQVVGGKLEKEIEVR